MIGASASRAHGSGGKLIVLIDRSPFPTHSRTEPEKLGSVGTCSGDASLRSPEDGTMTDIDAPRVWKLMHDIEICMLASHDGGVIRSRPLRAFPREQEHAVYFLTLAR